MKQCPVMRSLFTVGAIVFAAFSSSFVSAEESPRFEGVGSCAGSQCHGSVNPRNQTNVLQNEYSTWKKHDPHAEAWQTLLSEDSKRIAHHLGIDAASEAPLCLQCHTTYAPKKRTSEAFHYEDGVGCESCHGAAEKYLGPHAARTATHGENVKLGLTELGSVREQAKLCTTCHFGSDDKYVNHRLIGAGHPRLSFELDTFQSIEPRHWVVDDDYEKRKESYDPVDAWFAGQFAQALETLNRLQSEKRSRHGIFPEFSLFECASCHHSLKEEQWKRREYRGQPGVPLLNVSSLAMVREALNVSDRRGAEQLAPQIEKLRLSYMTGSGSGIETSLKGALLKHVQSGPRSKENSEKLLRHFVHFAAADPALPYETAEQIAMASSVFASVMRPDKSSYKSELDSIYATLKDPRNFTPEDFVKAAQSFQAKLTGRR